MGKKKKKHTEAAATLEQRFQEAVGLHHKGQFTEALTIYNDILGKIPENPDALYLSGVVYYQTGDNTSAVRQIRRAIKYNSKNPDYFTTLARAYNNLGLSFQEEGKMKEAIEAYQNALGIDASFTLALNNLGMVYKNTGNFAAAISCYEKAVSVDDSFYQAWLNFGIVLHDMNQLEDALRCYEKALSINPYSWQAYNNAGSVLTGMNETEDAVAFIKKAIELNPESGDSFFNLGCVCQETGDYNSAEDAYLKCIRFSGGNAVAFNNLGNIYKALYRYDEAIDCYCEAIKLNESFAGAYNNVGVLLIEMNNLDAAAKAFDSALRLEPDNYDCLYNKGLVLLKQKMPEKSLEYLKKAVAIKPDSVNINYITGTLYKDLGHYDRSIEHFKQALSVEPESVIALDQLMSVYQTCCFWEEYESLYNKMRIRKEGDESAQGRPFHCLSRYENPEMIYAASKASSDEVSLIVKGYNRKFDFTKRQTKEKIRIGYLSNTFSNHAGGHLISGLFGCHDRGGFEVFCYSYGPDDGSIYRKKIETTADSFIDIQTMTHLESAEKIYGDQIDILIDLRGHTADSRLEIAALRPAPVQVVYLGFPGTSGADFFDYLIADATTVPPGHEKYYSETIVKMPYCYQVNDITHPVADVQYTRSDLGLPEDGFVFCSFNNAYKYEPVMFKTWMSILMRCSGSVLWLLKTNELMVGNLKKEAEKFGIEKKRLIFAEKMPKAEHLERHTLADLGLDTRIYNGHTTTSDALMAGLPVLTVPGRTFPSRVSASILNAANMAELVMTDLEAYEEKAVYYAQNRHEVEALKNRIETTKQTMPLFDTAQFAVDLERHFFKMWDRYLDTNWC